MNHENFLQNYFFLINFTFLQKLLIQHKNSKRKYKIQKTRTLKYKCDVDQCISTTKVVLQKFQLRSYFYFSPFDYLLHLPNQNRIKIIKLKVTESKRFD